MRFYVPPNLQKDFQDALASGLATSFTRNFVSTDIFKAIVPEIDYRAKSGTTIRGQKPMYGDINVPLILGDYLQNSNGIYIVTMLEVEKFPQCYRIYTDSCNVKLSITRYEKEVYDSDGNITQTAGDYPIVSDIYCSSIMSGSQFQTNTGAVGIVPYDNLLIQTQFNDNTKVIAIGDNFIYFGQKYQVISLDYSQIDISGTSGMLVIIGKKVTN